MYFTVSILRSIKLDFCIILFCLFFCRLMSKKNKHKKTMYQDTLVCSLVTLHILLFIPSFRPAENGCLIMKCERPLDGVIRLWAVDKTGLWQPHRGPSSIVTCREEPCKWEYSPSKDMAPQGILTYDKKFLLPVNVIVQWRPHSGDVERHSWILCSFTQVSKDVITWYFPPLLMLPGTLFCILGPWTLSVWLLCVWVEPHGACNTLYMLLRRNHGEVFCRTAWSHRFERHWVEQVVFLFLHRADKFPPLAVWHLPEGAMRTSVPSMRPFRLRFTPTLHSTREFRTVVV